VNNENNQNFNHNNGQVNVQNTQGINYVGQQIQQPNNNIGMQNNIPIGNQISQEMTNNKKFNKKYIFIGIIILLVILLGIVVTRIFKSTIKDKNLSRTIMIYMVGSDLESEAGLATVDLDGIDYDSMDNENVNVLLIAGGAKEWQNDYIDGNETSIYELKENGFEKVKTQEIKNMGDYKVFSDFLEYSYDNYKTDEYDLIFWNHGGAILGSEFDELSDDYLSLKDWEEALKDSPFGSKNKLEMIIFSTCLNGTIEVAETFVDYADYLIASEEVTIGTQLDGDLKYINEVTKQDSAYDVALKYISAYKKKVNDYKELYKAHTGKENYIYSTYSLIDLSKIKELEKSVDDFFEDIDVSENYNKIAKVRSNLYQYAYDSSDDPTYDMVDLYNLVEGLKELSPTKAEKLLKNIESAVLYNYATNSKSRGISIYFPYNGGTEYQKAFLKLYKSFDSFDNYEEFISDFSAVKTSSYKKLDYKNNNINLNASETDADFAIELTDEQKESYAKASYIVFRDNKDGYYLPVYKGDEVNLDGNTLSANIKNKQLKVISTDDSTENIITLFETEVTDEYIKYNTNVTLEDFGNDNISNWKFNAATISLIYDKNKKTTKIGSVVLINDDEYTPNSVAIDLKDYSHVVFASSSYKILDENGNYNENWESNGIIEGIETKVNEIAFEQQTFDDEYDYYCIFRIYDTSNNYSYSKLVKMN